MKGNFRTLLRRFCLEGSVLGLKYLYLYPDPVSRCFWAFTMLLSTMAACLMTFLLQRRFMEAPTRITIENQFEPIHNMPYPAITLCSPNQITARAVEHFKQTLVNGNLSLESKELVSQALGFIEPLHDVNFKHLEQFQDIITNNRYSVVNVISLLTQSCKTFLKRCFFQNKLYPCEELFNPILTKQGVCCAFNSIYKFTNNKRNERIPNFMKYKAKKSGYLNGLTVITDYDPNDAVNGTILHGGATRVVFTDWSEFPADADSTLVHPNAEVFLLLSGIYTYCSEDVAQLPVVSRKCFFSDEMILPYFREYHHTDCELNCFISAVEDKCHCLLFFVPNVSLHRVCNFTAIPCIDDVKFHIARLSETTACRCERDCESRRYTEEHYSGNLKAVEHMINDRYSGIVFNESTTIMHFFFPKVTFEKQKQETVISFINLFSNLGGVFGMCLGCSCISLFEICFFIYVALRNYIRRRTMTRRRQRIGFYN